MALGDALFTKTQEKVLGLLFCKPDQSFYTNEIIAWAGIGRGTVMRELTRLSTVGIILKTHEGNQCYYQANPASPIYHELTSLVRKTFGIVDVIQQAIQSVAQPIILAFVYGSTAKGNHHANSDLDLLVISDQLAFGELISALSVAEQSLGRSINSSIYSIEQANSRLREKSNFLTKVMEQPKLWIVGTEEDLGSLGQLGQSTTTKKGTSEPS
jgi:predicted nucleotidyltransferase